MCTKVNFIEFTFLQMNLLLYSWIHLYKSEFEWIYFLQMNSVFYSWIHFLLMNSLLNTWIHFFTYEFPFLHMNSLFCTWIHFCCFIKKKFNMESPCISFYSFFRLSFAGSVPLSKKKLTGVPLEKASSDIVRQPPPPKKKGKY